MDVRVVVAQQQDRDRVANALLLAFSTDPMTRWVWPEPSEYVRTFASFAMAFGGSAFEHGGAHYAASHGGAALWLPPGVGPDEAAMDRLLASSVDPSKLETIGAILEQMASYHPEESHWYLPLIGVDPACQGRGCGAALLRFALERIDREGSAAYLESFNPANVPLYQRHGFEVVGAIQVGAAPPITPMVRSPKRRAGSDTGSEHSSAGSAR